MKWCQELQQLAWLNYPGETGKNACPGAESDSAVCVCTALSGRISEYGELVASHTSAQWGQGDGCCTQKGIHVLGRNYGSPSRYNHIHSQLPTVEKEALWQSTPTESHRLNWNLRTHHYDILTGVCRWQPISQFHCAHQLYSYNLWVEFYYHIVLSIIKRKRKTEKVCETCEKHMNLECPHHVPGTWLFGFSSPHPPCRSRLEEGPPGMQSLKYSLALLRNICQTLIPNHIKPNWQVTNLYLPNCILRPPPPPQ